MNNQVSVSEIKNFMSLKKPQQGMGFFSDGYSGDRESFIEGLEGSMEGCYTGRLIIVDKPTGLKAFNHMVKLMEKKHQNLAEQDLENFLAFYELKNGQVLLVNAEFGSSEELCSDLVDACDGEEGVFFDESCLTSKDMADADIDLPKEYQKALDELKK